MAENEDDHNQQGDDEGGNLFVGAASVDEQVDEDLQVQETKQHQWEDSKNNESGPVLIIHSVFKTSSHICHIYPGMIILQDNHAFQELGDVDKDGQDDDRQDVAAEGTKTVSFPVSTWMEDSQVPLDGDGDGHEDTAGEEDIVEGVEEVRKQMMMNLGDHTKRF